MTRILSAALLVLLSALPARGHFALFHRPVPARAYYFPAPVLVAPAPLPLVAVPCPEPAPTPPPPSLPPPALPPPPTPSRPAPARPPPPPAAIGPSVHRAVAADLRSQPARGERGFLLVFQCRHVVLRGVPHRQRRAMPHGGAVRRHVLE